MKFIFNKTKINFKSGFTLVESLVAIMILTISITAMLVILSNNVSEIDQVKRKVVANYLAQEGLEYVRNMRDTYMLYSTTGTGWPDFVAKMQACDKAFASDGCYFDHGELFNYPPPQNIIQTPFIPCTGSCPDLKYNPLTLDYNYDPGGENTSYSRVISTTIFPGQEEMYVYSTVIWRVRDKEYQMTFSENLFNWPGQ
ncbi:MAG: type II secretion system protein [Candidatus Pacebacteria bacterium]|jgi:prepilin-type N-terminal cleavage/methylation domain-containing protein|nr:type II secretion system protein [Candidatus Paceibacterota bacterium]MBP9851628.1 type II secretion system protein [Candidatus Paceibacterota bacterium]